MARRVVMVTGASGLLGTWLRKTIPSDVDLVSVTHRTAVPDSRCVSIDLRDAQAVAAAVAAVRPELIVHAAVAMDEASIVGATRNVVNAATAAGAGIVHVSTDAVFSGTRRSVSEGATPDPVWDYGRWKARAEDVVLASPVAGGCIVRLPLVVTLDPEDRAVERIRTHAAAGNATRWFDDEIRQPAMASDITEGLWRIAGLPTNRRAGTWHLMGTESLSRYEIACRVAKALRLDRALVEPEPTPPGLVRPRHLDLLASRAAAEIGWTPRPILS